MGRKYNNPVAKQLERVQEEWLLFLSVEKGASPHTVSNYRRDVQKYCAFHEAHGIEECDQITESSIEDFLASLSDARKSSIELSAT